ncbi:transposase [Streptomyces mirabilis]|uniref:transposase n=1 Tax=Streptomyces mirabilis TaxID=68239 RepID=UPI0033B81021
MRGGGRRVSRSGCTGHGTPLAVSLNGGNRYDATQLMPLRTPSHPSAGYEAGDAVAPGGYDFDKYRRLVRARGITPKIARRGTPHGSGLGRTRWVVERTFAWLHQFKRRSTMRWCLLPGRARSTGEGPV